MLLVDGTPPDHFVVIKHLCLWVWWQISSFSFITLFIRAQASPPITIFHSPISFYKVQDLLCSVPLVAFAWYFFAAFQHHHKHADVYKLKIIVIAFVTIFYPLYYKKELYNISLKWYCHKWLYTIYYLELLQLGNTLNFSPHRLHVGHQPNKKTENSIKAASALHKPSPNHNLFSPSPHSGRAHRNTTEKKQRSIVIAEAISWSSNNSTIMLSFHYGFIKFFFENDIFIFRETF